MRQPLNKIQDDKKYEQLNPHRQGIQTDYCKRLHGQTNACCQLLQNHIESANYDGENKKIEKHIETIHPEILPNYSLIFAPWKYHFQHPN